MKVDLVGLLSETCLHPGAEGSAGVVDLPVAREITTSYPVLKGSSLKGALRENLARLKQETTEEVFGMPDRVADVAVSDGRMLLLPIRTLVGHYKWVTCPYIVERFLRDLQLAGNPKIDLTIPKIGEGKALHAGKEEKIFLEEVVFESVKEEEFINRLADLLRPIMYHESLQNRLLEQLVVIDDKEFAYFAQYGLEIRARNKLGSETKTSENLWFEECLPPDTLFYTLLLARPDKAASLEHLREVFSDKPYLQIGGNETIGQGWCVLSRWREGGEQ